MTALKAHEVEAWLARALKNAAARPRLVLVYGPDAGLVQERCAALTRAFTKGDAAGVVRLDGDALSADPGLLSDEANSASLFGGERAIWLRAGTKSVTEALEPLFETLPLAALVVEAGDLKPSHPLRKRFETASQALALPCYADDAQSLGRLIDEELRAANLTLEAPARTALLRHLGGDRLASRQEIRKLCLYAQGQATITLADVDALTGDVAALALDVLLDSLGLGMGDQTLIEVQRHRASGTPASVVLSLAARHMLTLQLLRAEVDEGRTSMEALRSASPPVFFKRHTAMERQMVLWSQEKITRALDSLFDAQLKARQFPVLADAISERAFLDVAQLARARG